MAGFPRIGRSELLWSIAAGVDAPILYLGERSATGGARWCVGIGFHHDDSPHDDLGVLIRLVHKAHRALGIRAVFIDDLHRYGGVRYSSLRSKLRRSFLRLPRELGLAVVASYSVAESARDDRRARWSDLYGTVVEDPDMLILVHPESDVPPAVKLRAFRQGNAATVSETFYLRRM